MSIQIQIQCISYVKSILKRQIFFQSYTTTIRISRTLNDLKFSSSNMLQRTIVLTNLFFIFINDISKGIIIILSSFYVWIIFSLQAFFNSNIAFINLDCSYFRFRTNDCCITS